MKRILVTGAGGSPSYNYIQSLRDNPNKEKFYIVGIDINKYFLELIDVDARYLVPKTDDSNYLSIINSIVEKEKIDFLHCQPEQEVLFFSKNRDKLKTKTFFPTLSTVEICQNKMALMNSLNEYNIPIPETYRINSEDDLKIAFSKLLKNDKKVWLRAIKGAGSKAALPVSRIEHARMWIDYWRVMKGISYGDFMVSEFLPGNEYAFQSVWSNGNLIMSQARQRVEYLFGNLFISGQSSSPSVAVTVQNNEVNQLASSSIKAIDKNASGIFCVDLKTDKRGRVAITEINAGRFFTTSYFFSKAGCNMPYYYTKLGMGDISSVPLKPYNNLPSGLFWIRMVDMGYKLVEGSKWIKK